MSKYPDFQDVMDYFIYFPDEGVFIRRETGCRVGAYDASTGYINLYMKGNSYTAHSLAILIATGKPVERGYHIHHINFDGTDNRLVNLYVCTKEEHRRCHGAYKGSSSKYRGVYWNSRRQKWHARTQINKKPVHLGYFANEIDAAMAYDEKALEAYPNEPHLFLNRSLI